MSDATTEPLSKTQRKHAMHELQAVGERLLTLKASQIAQLHLPESLLEALQSAKKITAHGALVRQKQYIGRLMREIDAAPIVAQLAAWDDQQHARLQQVERHRARLLEDDAALAPFIAEYPHADSQRLRTLLRNARKAGATKSQEQLFRLLRDIIDYPGWLASHTAGSV